MPYTVGIDVGGNDDFTAITVGEMKDGVLYVLAYGSGKNLAIAWAMAFNSLRPWWKRWLIWWKVRNLYVKPQDN